MTNFTGITWSNMTPFNFLNVFWLYWLVGLILLYIFKRKIPVLHFHYTLGKKVFLLVVSLYICSWFCWSLIKNESKLSFIGILVLLAILFNVTGIAIFAWYCYKSRGIIFAFPILLLSRGFHGAKEFIEKKEEWDKKEQHNNTEDP